MGLEKVKSYPGVYRLTSTKRRHKDGPDICYYIYYKVGGKARKEKVGWKSEGYTAQIASEMRGEQIKRFRHGIVQDKPVTIEEMWDIVKEEYKQKKDARGPYQRYKEHIKPHIGKTTLDEITPQTLNWLLSKYKEQNLSDGSIAHIFCILKKIYKTAKSSGKHTKESPFEYFKFNYKNNNRTRYLTYDEAQTLLNELYEQDYEVYAMTVFALHTGARLGEVIKLKWPNVNFNDNTVILKERKSGKDDYVYLTNKLKRILENKHEHATSDYVFESPINGKKRFAQTPSTFNKTVDKLFNKNCDFQDRVTFHTLRHTFASWLVMQGTPLYYVSKLLGHSTITMTERYAHLAPDITKSEIERMFDSGEEKKGKVINFE